jgi:hypothetical protein
MYKSVKDKLTSEEQEKQLMASEIDRLHKEIQRREVKWHWVGACYKN